MFLFLPFFPWVLLGHLDLLILSFLWVPPPSLRLFWLNVLGKYPVLNYYSQSGSPELKVLWYALPVAE